MTMLAVFWLLNWRLFVGGGDTDCQAVFSMLCHFRNVPMLTILRKLLPHTHPDQLSLWSRFLLVGNCYILKLTLDTMWSHEEFNHMTYSLLNKSLAFIFIMRQNSNYSCHDLFISYSYSNNLSLLRGKNCTFLTIQAL